MGFARLARMRVGLFLAGCSLLVACGSKGGGGDDGGDGDAGVAPTLRVDLTSHQLHWVDGTTTDAPTAKATLVAADGTETDVTDRVTWAISPAGAAAVSGTSLSATGTAAGPGVLTADYAYAEGQTGFEVFVEQTVDGGTNAAPAGTADLFNAATADTTATVALAYPPANALVPSNLGAMDVHWRDAANDRYEVTLSGGYVTLKTYVVPSNPRNYTVFTGDQWSQLSGGSAGVDLDIRVRALSSSAPTTFIEGSEKVRIGANAIKGGVYWWNTTDGSNAFIYRYDMENQAVPPEQFFPQPNQSGTCVGCHAVSRDGTVVSYRQDGGTTNYGNAVMVTGLTKRLTQNTQSWSYTTIHPNDTDLISTRNDGMWVTDMGTGAASHIYSTSKVTHPDFSVDGSTIVAASVASGDDVYANVPANGTNQLVVFDYDAATKTVGQTPTPIVTSAANTYAYYPGYSPDNKWVLYNVASGASSYNNLNSQLWVVSSAKPASGAPLSTPIRLTEAEGPAGQGNSWPKWTPFTSQEAGPTGANETVIWFTVASYRAFGVRTTNGDHQLKPQLWLAPFYPDRVGNTQGLPVTGPAVRLPFQKLDQGNHIAQWTQKIVNIF
ncbi:MAG TPA: hypothetical protein VGM90_24840 [Kofleriaceae bacterium]|jgi:TolB protein